MAEITQQMLLQKFQEFKEDQTALTQVKKQGVKILAPGFLIELFVFDISKEANLEDDDYYVRHTGVAKILQASHLNNSPDAKLESHADLKENDIVLLGDHMAVMRLNEEWENWYEHQKSPNADTVKEPIKYVKGFYTLISQGRLFYINRGDSLLTGKNLRFGEDEIKWYRGPYVTFADPQDILYQVDNPFADVEG